MELLFLWVDDYLIFKKQSFTFCGDLQFNLQVKEGNAKDDVDLRVSRNDGYVNIFPQNITGITGIVGKNGSGKSSLLQLLKTAKGNMPLLLSRLIYCYRTEDEPHRIVTRYYGDGRGNAKPLLLKITSLDAAIDVSDSSPYKVKKDILLQSEIENGGGIFDEIDIVYYSNVIDSTREDIFSKVHNLSTNYLLFDINRRFLEEYTKKPAGNKSVFDQLNPLIDFHKDELKKQIEYISFAKRSGIKNIPKLPGSLLISFTNSDYHFLTGELGSSRLFNRTSLETFQQRCLDEINKMQDLRQKFLASTRVLSFYYALHFDTFRKEVSSTAIYDFFETALSSTNPLSSLMEFILGLSPRKYSKTIGLKRVFTHEIETALNKVDLKMTELGMGYEVKISDDLWGFLKMIFDIKYLGDGSFFEFSWGNKISAGEDFFLRHFSRFYSIMDDLSSDNLIVLIDEGDLYFHPEWQKEYLSSLITFFETVYVGRKVQLVITSHSPFIVSDIPRFNLIFLEDGVSDDKELFKETFGANIHTLMTDAFFLKGLISSYAKRKIDSAIAYLNGNIGDDWENDDEVQRFIRIIGEPLLRNQLQKMLDSKKISGMSERVNDMEKRIKRLENGDQ